MQRKTCFCGRKYTNANDHARSYHKGYYCGHVLLDNGNTCGYFARSESSLRQHLGAIKKHNYTDENTLNIIIRETINEMKGLAPTQVATAPTRPIVRPNGMVSLQFFSFFLCYKRRLTFWHVRNVSDAKIRLDARVLSTRFDQMAYLCPVCNHNGARGLNA